MLKPSFDYLDWKSADGSFKRLWTAPATKISVAVIVILILIFASGYVMRIITHAVREYKNLQSAIRAEVQVVRVPA